MSRISRRTVGDIEIVSLQDGETVFGREVFPGVDLEAVPELRDRPDEEILTTNFNSFLVRSGDETILVDCGPRNLFGDTCGFLVEAMSEAGASPEDVTHLLFTHMHPDHVAGSIREDGTAVFENAAAFVTGTEHEFWSNDANFAGADEMVQDWRNLNLSVFNAYQDRLHLSGNSDEIGGLLRLVDLPGHTPGHVGFRVDSGSDCFMSVTDLVHVQAVQLVEPNYGIVFDVDRDAARETRLKTLDMLATDRLLFSGGHILRPKFGYIDRSGSGYRFVGA